MLNLPQGFKIGAAEAVDSRLILSKAEMVTIKDSMMPDTYLAVCKDNSIDPETGKFRVYASAGSEIIQMEAMTEDEILAITSNS